MEFEIGIDEAGRGAWAGPIVACALLKAKHHKLPTSIKDSKELSEKQRELCYTYLKSHFHFGIGVVEAGELDSNGLTWANKECMKQALSNLKSKLHIPPSTQILIDGMDLKIQFIGALTPKYIIDGDKIWPIISAASIIAKVHRDRIMHELATKLPVYGFETHKGYGTKKHKESIELYGQSDAHRISYKPLKDIANKKEIFNKRAPQA